MRGCEDIVVASGVNRRAADPGPPAAAALGPAAIQRREDHGVGARHVLIALGIIAAGALVLLWMGRLPICKCGYVKLWHGAVQSAENSQHLTDWYTPTHVVHGMLYYAGLWLVSRVTGWPLRVGQRLILATVIAASWEIVENTDYVIARYREATIALDYTGDSIINSISDMLAMLVGFVLAWRLPVAATIALALALELFVGYWIRDNLTLNVLMLLYPLDAIKAWQNAG
jgi:hypothetical protein